MGWIDRRSVLAVAWQCELAGMHGRSRYGRQAPRIDAAKDLLQCPLIDEEYTRRPFYGSRRMVAHLERPGRLVNRKQARAADAPDGAGRRGRAWRAAGIGEAMSLRPVIARREPTKQSRPATGFARLRRASPSSQ